MPKVNGKEYPYTAAGMAAAKKAAQNKKKPNKDTVTKDDKKKMQEKMKSLPKPKISGSTTSKKMPSKAMNKAIPGNPGVNLGSAAKKFVMSMPPVMAARGAAKIGMAAGKAINDTMNPPKRQMKRMPGTVGDMLRKPGRPGPTPRTGGLDQIRPMRELPARPGKKLLPKKPGR